MNGVIAATAGARKLNAVARPTPSGATAHCRRVVRGGVWAERTSVIWMWTLWMLPGEEDGVRVQVSGTEQRAAPRMPRCEMRRPGRSSPLARSRPAGSQALDGSGDPLTAAQHRGAMMRGGRRTFLRE